MTQCHLSWDSYKKNICNGFARLQRSEEFVDMTLAADGYLVQVHKSLIALASPYIMRMLKTAPCANPVVFLNGVNYDVLTYLLEYIYTGEVKVPSNRMNDFLQQAKALRIIGVESVMPPMDVRQHLRNLNQNSETVEHRRRDFNDGETRPNNSNSQQPHFIIGQHTQNDSTATTEQDSHTENSQTRPNNSNSEQPLFIIGQHTQNDSTATTEQDSHTENSQTRPNNSNSDQPLFIIGQHKQNDSTEPVESHSEIENIQTMSQNSNIEQSHFIIEQHKQNDSTATFEQHSEIENSQTGPHNINSEQPHFIIKQHKQNDATATVESHFEIENSQTVPQNSNSEQPHFIIELHKQKDSSSIVESHSEIENSQTRPHNRSKQPRFIIKQCKQNYSTALVESHSEIERKSTNTNTIDMTNNSIAVNGDAMDTNYEPHNDIIDLVSDVCIENVNNSTAISNTVQSDHEALKYELETLVSITNLSENAKYQSDCSVFDNNDACVIKTEVDDNIIPYEEPQYNTNDDGNENEWNENVENVMLENDVTECFENNTNEVPQPANYTIELKLLTEDGQTKPQLITSFNPSIEPVQGSSFDQTVFPSNEIDKKGSPIYYMVTFRDRLMAILNRYMYYSHHLSHNGHRRRWRCIDYRHKRCKALIDTDGEYILNRKFVHNHPFHDMKIMKRAQNKKTRMFTTIASALAASAAADE